MDILGGLRLCWVLWVGWGGLRVGRCGGDIVFLGCGVLLGMELLCFFFDDILDVVCDFHLGDLEFLIGELALLVELA